MGLKSRRAFSAASPDQVLVAAKAVQLQLAHVDKPINMSLLRVPHLTGSGIAQYGIVQFNDKEKSFATVPEPVEQAFNSVTFTGDEQLEIRRRLLLDMNLAVAVELSRANGQALYVVHSDAYCSSGYILFEGGRAIDGAIYGWEGNEVLFEFDTSMSRSFSLPAEQTQYGSYASLGLSRHLNIALSYGEYLGQFDYSSAAIERYRIMLQKEFVQALSPEAF